MSMPQPGDPASRRCPQCGQSMYWTERAVLRAEPFAGTLADIESGAPYLDAYRCANGHTSRECPLCGSYDTTAWIDEAESYYHVICGACGNDSVVPR